MERNPINTLNNQILFAFIVLFHIVLTFYASLNATILGLSEIFTDSPDTLELAYWQMVEGLMMLPLVKPLSHIIGSYWVDEWGWLLIPVNSYLAVWITYDLTRKLNVIFLRSISVLKNYNIDA
jgi:hypothetical protein